MLRTYESFLVLKTELEGDLEVLRSHKEFVQKARARIESSPQDEMLYGALGYGLHNTYSLLENYFLRVTKFFENGLPAEAWHKTLVDRMCLDIPGLRPALITEKALKTNVMTLLKFRHKFRNLYAEGLNSEKTLGVYESTLKIFRGFPNIHSEFLGKLEGIFNSL